MIRLTPVKSGSPLILAAILVPFLVLGYFYEGYEMGNWHLAYDFLTMPIGLLAFILAIKYGFASGVIEFSEDEFRITHQFRGERSYEWKYLKYYGYFESVFMIQFGDNTALQILPGAYLAGDWSKLENFLTSHFPDRKADGFGGARLFKSDT
jgi:hypothetical protein